MCWSDTAVPGSSPCPYRAPHSWSRTSYRPWRRCCPLLTSDRYPGSPSLSVISHRSTTNTMLTVDDVCFQTPRSEALSLMGSLMCFPNHYQDLQVLNVGDLSVESLSSNVLKVGAHIVNTEGTDTLWKHSGITSYAVNVNKN